VRARGLLWTAFVLVHVGLAWLCLFAPGLPLGDVTLVYRPWSMQLASGAPIVGIGSDWVYPLLAHLPMQLSLIAGEAAYGSAWLVLMTVLDAVAFAILLGDGSSRRRLAAAGWWVAFIALLGPISLGRIDSVTVPLSVVAVLIVMRRPLAASLLLSIATWMKVWPAAVIVAAVVALRSRWRIVFGGAVLSIAVVFVAFALGGAGHVFSFLSEQSGRGLQIEAPVSLIYVWQAAAGVEGAFIYYDPAILTYQVAGADVDVAIALMTPLLVLAFAAVALVGVVVVRGGAPVVRVLPAFALGLILVLIAVNKVGSPQYLTWLIAPIVLGIAWQGRRYTVPAVLTLGLGALTHVVYPYLYWLLLSAWPPMVAVLTIRNVGYLVLLGWCIVELLRARRDVRGRRAERADENAMREWRESRMPASGVGRDADGQIRANPAVPPASEWLEEGISGVIRSEPYAGSIVLAAIDVPQDDGTLTYRLYLPAGEMTDASGERHLMDSLLEDDLRNDGDGGMIDLLTTALDVRWSTDPDEFDRARRMYDALHAPESRRKWKR
jgi:hypothetical protein